MDEIIKDIKELLDLYEGNRMFLNDDAYVMIIDYLQEQNQSYKNREDKIRYISQNYSIAVLGKFGNEFKRVVLSILDNKE